MIEACTTLPPRPGQVRMVSASTAEGAIACGTYLRAKLQENMSDARKAQHRLLNALRLRDRETAMALRFERRMGLQSARQARNALRYLEGI